MGAISDIPEAGYNPVRAFLSTWVWSALSGVLLAFACLAGGMSGAAETQVFTAATGILLILLLADAKCRTALQRLPDLRLALIGLLLVYMTWIIQFAPVMVCMTPPPAWARANMVSVDPQWGWRGIVSFGSVIGFFLVGALLGADRKRERSVFIALGAVLVIVFVHAVFDYWHEQQKVRDPSIPDVLRLDGAFQSANTLASLWIVGMLGSAGMFLAQAPRRGGAGRSRAFWLSGFVVLVCLLGLVATLSRAGIAIGFIMLAILTVFAWPERRGLIVLGFVGLGAALALLGMFGERLGLPVREVNLLASFTTRLPEWKAAIDLTIMRPCLGWGVGSFQLVVEAVREAPTQSLSLVSVTPHNLVLLISAETGVIGLTAWLVLAVGATKAASVAIYRNNNIAAIGLGLGLCGVFLHNLLDFSFAVPATAGFFALALGFLVGKGADLPKKIKRVIVK